MPLNLVLPRPRISAQVYIAIVLTGGGVVRACGPQHQVRRRDDRCRATDTGEGLEAIVLLARAEVLLEENRRLVDAAILGAAAAAAAAQVQTYQASNAELARLLQRLGYAASAPLSRRFEWPQRKATRSSGWRSLPAAKAPSQPRAMPPPATTCATASAWSDSTDQRRRSRPRPARGQGTRPDRVDTRWRRHCRRADRAARAVPAAPGAQAHRRGRGGVGPPRPQRYLGRNSEILRSGTRLANSPSVAVFKAKSIALLHKQAELERLNLQLDVAINNMPLGLSMFDAQERLLVCNTRYAEMYRLPGELTMPSPRCGGTGARQTSWQRASGPRAPALPSVGHRPSRS